MVSIIFMMVNKLLFYFAKTAEINVITRINEGKSYNGLDESQKQNFEL